MGGREVNHRGVGFSYCHRISGELNRYRVENSNAQDQHETDDIRAGESNSG